LRQARVVDILMLLILTLCKNCSLNPALLGFFSVMGTLGAAAAAAAARVGIPDRGVGCLSTAVDTVAVADDGSFVVDEVSLHRTRGFLSSFSGLGGDSLLESSLSASNISFLNVLDDIVYAITWRSGLVLVTA